MLLALSALLLAGILTGPLEPFSPDATGVGVPDVPSLWAVAEPPLWAVASAGRSPAPTDLQEPAKSAAGLASAEGCWREPCGALRSCSEVAAASPESGPLAADGGFSRGLSSNDLSSNDLSPNDLSSNDRGPNDRGPDEEGSAAKQSTSGTAPEPATLLLVGAGLVGLALAARRVRRGWRVRQPSRAY